MSTVDYIKSKIKRLYETNPNICISVKKVHTKVAVEAISAKIVGVYQNIFQIEENNNGHINLHTYQYGDVLIGQVVIKELDYTPLENVSNKK